MTDFKLFMISWDGGFFVYVTRNSSSGRLPCVSENVQYVSPAPCLRYGIR